MDELQDYEIELLMSNIHYSYKNEWEMTRMIMYSEMLPYMKKGSDKKPKDILSLPTDDDYEEHDNVSEHIGNKLTKQKYNVKHIICQAQ